MPRPTRLLPFLLAALGAGLSAQDRHHWVLPSRSAIAPMGTGVPVQVTAVTAHVKIADRAAVTTLEIDLHNPAGRDQEAVLLLPLPDGASVSAFTFLGAAAEPTARILPRDEARRLYDEITSKLRDPALLEFAGWNCLRSSVFPVPAGGRQKLRLRYDHVLQSDGERVDYVLPRSEMLGGAPWDITVELVARAAIGVCHSTSHELDVTAADANTRRLRVRERCRRDPGSFRLCWTTVGDAAQPTAALFAYPDPTIGGGWFLLLANVPQPPVGAVPQRREVTLVIDRSGSMAGRKLEQTKAAALQVLEGLRPGEGFQILDYGNDVGRAFAQPVVKDATTLSKAREYVASILPHGGTNLHDALVEALRAPALPGTLPLVLFLTDGVPTVGPTSERELAAVTASGNPHGRRLFCFGVGSDVNVPLLDRLAESTRAITTYVLPDEDVEVKVARTFARLGEPVLARPELQLAAAAGGPTRLREVLPRSLPDLFQGDQLVVLGQYRGEDDLQFELHGAGAGGARSYRFTLPVRSASTAHAFVPRLWASRQIAFLVDELRQQAGDLGGPLQRPGHDPFADPRNRELRDEILRLSTRFGVMGEYTSFLATEGSRLDDWQALTMACQQALAGRAVATRSGAAAVNQGCNLWAQKGQITANASNRYLDAGLREVETSAIQQVCDRSFFRRGERWIDGNSVLAQRLEPDQRIELGTPEFFTLLRRLETQNRGGVLSLHGEILLEVDGRNVLVVPPTQTLQTLETIR